MPILPTPADARAAADALCELVIRTPVLDSLRLDQHLGMRIIAKAEGLQRTGSFKVRGAVNRVRTLTDAERSAGLITISAGNAALGAAHAARMFGAQLTVVMPENAVPEKLAAVEAYGGRVVKDGVTSAVLAFERAAALQAAEGLTLVHPFDDPMVVAGAATATIELLEDCPELDRLLVPCSGGGLLAGAILAAETVQSGVEIVGVQPEGADGMVRSLRAGEPTPVPHVETVADGLTAPKPGAVPFEMVRRAGIEVVTVTDAQILDALRLAVTSFRLVLEPAAAAPLAALVAYPHLQGATTTGMLLSGSNVRYELLAGVLA